MKLLLITGRLGEAVLKRVVASVRTAHSVEILALPVEVAALLTPELIYYYLKELGDELRKYDLIIVPGHVKGSLKEVSKRLGIRVVKGTLHATDIDRLLELDDEELSILSESVPADDVLAEREFLKCYELLKQRIEKGLPGKAVELGRARVYPNPPPLTMAAEVVLSSTDDIKKLDSEVQRFAEFGVGIVIVSPIFDPEPGVMRSILKIFESHDMTAGIDHPKPSVLKRAVSIGFNLVANVDIEQLAKLGRDLRDVGVIAVLPMDADVARSASKLVELSKSFGIEKLVLDPVLTPPIAPGFINSVDRYRRVREVAPEVPLAANINNIVEYVDADSTGILGLLIPALAELGVGLIVAMELSPRSYGLIEEASTATYMTTCAVLTNRAPSGYTPHLLVAKERKRIEVELGKADRVVEARAFQRPRPDPAGLFKIRVVHGDSIEVLHIGRRGRTLIRGCSAAAIYQEAIKQGLVTTLEHAAYLGQELAKAEEALRSGKNYVQDEELLKRPRGVMRVLLRKFRQYASL